MSKLYDKVWDDPHYEGLMANKGWLKSIINDHDSELTCKLQAAISQDSRIPTSDRQAINICVNHGIVHLEGSVNDPISMEYAFRDVMNIDDFIKVENDIDVNQLGKTLITQ